MKPTIQFNEKSGDFSERERRRCFTFPMTDYSFHAATMAKTSSRCLGSCRSLRAISQDYFENEEPRSFASEAALFSVMMMTAVFPILSSVNALVNLLRSIGTF